jgi:hypothetical protein
VRIPKGWIPILAGEILKALRENDLVEFSTDEAKVKQALVDAITEELLLEDRVNQEVREILKQYESQISQGGADYRKLFDLTKQKLVRERDLIL